MRKQPRIMSQPQSVLGTFTNDRRYPHKNRALCKNMRHNEGMKYKFSFLVIYSALPGLQPIVGDNNARYWTCLGREKL